MITKNFNEVLAENKTAFYIFNTLCAKKRIEYIRSKMPESVKICYAVKANTFIIKELIDYVERFEICSPGEFEICSKLNVPTCKMVISGVYKTPEFVEDLVASQSNDYILTVESLTQFSQFKQLSQQHKKHLNILLRLTNDSQFGINANEIEEIIVNRNNNPFLNIIGIQYFSGTQKTSIKKLKREIEMLDTFLCKLQREYDFTVEELEYGTGFPISYFKGEEMNEEEFFNSFSQLVSNMTFKTNVIIELGRSIAASCGRYYTHIVDIKRNGKQNYAMINGGMHQISYFGQYMAMKQPYLTVLGKENLPPISSWNICGSLCSMNDIVAKQAELPEIQIGDILCFEKTGAYSATEGIALFLSRDIPSVYLLTDDQGYICVRTPIETSVFNTPNY